jgi:hypothetical protein
MPQHPNWGKIALIYTFRPVGDIPSGDFVLNGIFLHHGSIWTAFLPNIQSTVITHFTFNSVGDLVVLFLVWEVE